MDDGRSTSSAAMLQAINDALDRAGENNRRGGDRRQRAGVQRRVRPQGVPLGDVQASIDMLKGRVHVAPAAVVPPSRWWRPAPGPRSRWAVPGMQRRSPNRRARVQLSGQRGGDRDGAALPALEVLRLRLTPSAYQQAVGLAKVFFWRDSAGGGLGWTRSTCRRWCCPERWRPLASSRRCRPVRIWPARSGARQSALDAIKAGHRQTSIPSSGCPVTVDHRKVVSECRLSCVGRRSSAAGVVAVALAVPAAADDGGMPPCGLKLAMLCNMLPVFADLDHDVDLTQDRTPWTAHHRFGAGRTPDGPLPQG